MCVRSMGRCDGPLSGGGVVYADAIALWCRSAGITPSRVLPNEEVLAVVR